MTQYRLAAWRIVFVFLVVLVPLNAQDRDSRLIVLGFDGLDYQRCQQYMDEGILPNLKALAEEGTFSALATTNPAISPVSWSALTTGLNPGETGIDGFLRRDFSSGDVRIKPALVTRSMDNSGLSSLTTRRLILWPLFVVAALLGIRAWRRRRWSLKLVPHTLLLAVVTGLLTISERSLPDGMPVAENLRQGKAWWEVLDAAGVSTATMLAPCSFPAPVLKNGRLLAGLGVPDALGTFGYWTHLRDDVVEESTTETGGFVKPLIYVDVEARDGKFEPIELEGPLDLVARDGSYAGAPLALTLGRANGVVYITDGIRSMQLDLSAWSDPFPITFKMSSFVNVRGFCRFKLLELDDRVRLYVDPVNLDPRRLPPGVRLSSPESWAGELVEETNRAYKTVGWACATNALKDRVLDDASFLQDARRVWEDQENLALHELKKGGARVITCILTVPDRIQHMFTRYEFRGYRGPDGRMDPRFRQEVREVYKRVDAFVGLVRKSYMSPEDELMIVSDHGMAPWRRSVNLNALLVREGLLVLKSRLGARKLDRQIGEGLAMAHIDWSRTKAYSLGLGRIYLNRRGREPEGIVTKEEAPLVLDAVRRALMSLQDGDQSVVSSVSSGEDIYSQDKVPGGRADLYVGFHRGYRVSWQSCLGGVDEPVVFENDSPWSADHCSVDPKLVPGVLFTTLPLKSVAPRVVDIAPTVLDWAGQGRDLGDDRNGNSLLRSR